MIVALQMADGGFRPAYNTQLAAETGHGLVGGVAISTSGGDQPSLEPMVEQVIGRYGRKPKMWLADGGFFNRETVTRLGRSGPELFCPPHKVHAGDRRDDEAVVKDTPEVTALRVRMASDEGQAHYRQRARWIEWVNAGYRARNWWQVAVRGADKVLTLAKWQALTHNMLRIQRSEALNAAFPRRLSLA